MGVMGLESAKAAATGSLSVLLRDSPRIPQLFRGLPLQIPGFLVNQCVVTPRSVTVETKVGVCSVSALYKGER
jgi:hypothetical protein